MESCTNIIIRSSGQQYSDLHIRIRLDSAVADLKERIEQEHPASPKASLQKLIYDGKILSNQHQLHTIVKENNVVIHLAYVYDSNQTTEPVKKQETSLRNRLSHVPVPDPMPTRPDQLAYSQAYNAWMQQYHHQYSNYMQYYYDMASANAGIPLTAQAEAIHEDTAAIPDQAPEPDQQMPNVDAGLAVDDEEGQDWLDALFAFTRFLMMLSIIYFYSTTLRFAIALALLLIVHLYQAGFFQVNRRAPPPPQRNQNNQQDMAEGAVPDDNNNSETNPDNEDAVPPTPSLFATAICFIRSFFSSLIPTGPPGVVN